MGKAVFRLSEDDVWALAESKKIVIPEDKKEHVLYTVKKAVESYCFEGAYNIWDAIEDGIRDALSE
jgi:hypothetical protein